MENVNKTVRNSCPKCTQTKLSHQKPYGLLHPNQVLTRPFQIIAMDFITDLPESSGYDAILTVICRLSKRGYFIPCNKTCDSEGAARLFI